MRSGRAATGRFLAGDYYAGLVSDRATAEFHRGGLAVPDRSEVLGHAGMGTRVIIGKVRRARRGQLPGDIVRAVLQLVVIMRPGRANPERLLGIGEVTAPFSA